MERNSAPWQNVHVYYYDDPNDLLLDCIQPLFESLRPAVSTAFFVRHWLRGPHLRLRFRCSNEQFATLVRPAVEDQIRRYLQAHPSTSTIDLDQMQLIYNRLAIEEAESEPLLPLAPNNSIQYLPYDRRLHIMQSEALATLFEDFYVDTTDLAFTMLRQIRAGASRLALSLELMLTMAYTGASDITYGIISYRSHAEAFIARSPNPDATRAFFDSRYAAHAKNLQARLRYLVESLERQDDRVPLAATWAALSRRYRQRVRAEADLKPLMPETPTELTPEQQLVLEAKRRHSAFHSLMIEDAVGSDALWQRPTFHRNRLMLNMQYLYLSRLGGKPFERYLLCHLAANTVEDVYGVSATHLLQQQLDRLKVSTL